ncbi:MAG TPA: 50S ribosomal protein L9 [Lachnospiraceae bacterium]|nr:50S ribosomal protein L9 [Lachnospiraceae bacterium]
MKVILLEDIKTLGKKGEIVTVSDGYAKNFIFPKKLGAEATKKNLNELKLQKIHDEKMAEKILKEAKEFAEVLETKQVVVKLRTGEGGRTFGSVSSKEIAEEAKLQFDLEIDKKKMQLPEQIKNIGTYEIPVKLHPQVTAMLKVKVEEA